MKESPIELILDVIIAIMNGLMAWGVSDSKATGLIIVWLVLILNFLGRIKRELQKLNAK